MVRLANDKDLERALTETKGYLVACFYDYGSVPCEHFKPEFEAIAEALERKAVFLKIDATENPGITEELKIRAVPTTVLYKDTVEVKRWEGPYKHASLRERILEQIGAKKKGGAA